MSSNDRDTTELPRVQDESATVGRIVDGKYRLAARLGEGAMGVVFRAQDVRLEREVAVKIAKREIVDDPRIRALLQREAGAMAKLRHPNVVEIYDVGTWGGCPYLVMPYLRGHDLRAWCNHHGGAPVAVDVAIGIMDQVCAGLAAMHDAGLIHGDIKPSNILVSESFVVSLGDLGMAHYAHDRAWLEDAGGTPGFLAPELVLDAVVRPELMPKTDIYAAGVTAYWLLTGTLPSSSDLHELEAGFPSAIVAPSVHRPELPLAVDAPILAALSFDPTERPDATELRELLVAVEAAMLRGSRTKPPFVVVVDDDPQALAFAEALVREAEPDAEVVILQDPRAALAVIESHLPDLLIVDLAMPYLNGIELSAIVRGNPKTRDVPIAVFSAVGGAAERKVLERIGAAHFLAEPVDPDTMLDVVRRMLRPPGGQGRP